MDAEKMVISIVNGTFKTVVNNLIILKNAGIEIRIDEIQQSVFSQDTCCQHQASSIIFLDGNLRL